MGVPDAPEGMVRVERMTSQAMGDLDLFTAVPAGHGDGAGLPVVVVLHGSSASAAHLQGFGLGRFVTNEAAPRQIAYETDGLIWDAGVLWRPSRRTATAVAKPVGSGGGASFDAASQTSYFFYDDAGTKHQLWFDDAQTLSMKYERAKDWGLGGVAIWALTHGYNMGEPISADWRKAQENEIRTGHCNMLPDMMIVATGMAMATSTS